MISNQILVVFLNLKLLDHNVRVRHNDSRQLAEDNPRLEEEVEFLRLHQLFLLHPALVALSVCRLAELQNLKNSLLTLTIFKEFERKNYPFMGGRI